jgi:phosphoenolpyruvate carboxykinase (GTP)
MSDRDIDILSRKMTPEHLQRLFALRNRRLWTYVADAVELCNPDWVYVATDSPEDIAYVRRMATQFGEETALKVRGHTCHFDGPNDQGRDKEVTKYLLRPGVSLGKGINSMDRNAGLDEVRSLLKGSMLGRVMLLRFFSLGPVDSAFSISGVQATDSFYVGHSEDILYRAGYEQFKRIGDSPEFIAVLHSAGKLVNHVSAEVEKKRIYIDLDEKEVYSVNTQYAGNTVGFKKLSLRLAIRKADAEGWLSEHMFLMGVHGPKGRVTYFSGAYPSACGKTSTAMLQGETIIGDDIAYLRNIGGACRAVNVECGIFGIIKDVNAEDDPIIWRELTSPGEVIFSNVLITDGEPHWEGDKRPVPEEGVNYQGPWKKGMVDAKGNPVDFSHKNARYTIRLGALANLDPKADDPKGVEIGAIIYGGRDSDTWVPVRQSFDWLHGVVTMGASLESETTAAVIGKVGVRAFQPMANLDFVSIPLGKYIQNHLDFGARLGRKPVIFSTNYFLKDKAGKYITGMADKRVWVKWMELRCHKDVEALVTPTGLIPLYADLKRLFKEVLGRDYTEGDYNEQFKLRVPENLAKLDRIEKLWRTDVPDTPAELLEVLSAQRERLLAIQARLGDYVLPGQFASAEK